MPNQQSLVGPDGKEARFVHASMIHNRDGIYPETTDAELERKINGKISPFPEAPSLFAVGHTHRALIRSLNGTLVVNAGSVGLPFDHDRRAGYAQIVWGKLGWEAKIVRLEYDRAQAERDFFETGYFEEAGPLIRLVLIELRTAVSQLYSWSIRYQQQALNGEISMEESVRRYLEE